MLTEQLSHNVTWPEILLQNWLPRSISLGAFQTFFPFFFRSWSEQLFFLFFFSFQSQMIYLIEQKSEKLLHAL